MKCIISLSDITIGIQVQCLQDMRPNWTKLLRYSYILTKHFVSNNRSIVCSCSCSVTFFRVECISYFNISNQSSWTAVKIYMKKTLEFFINFGYDFVFKSNSTLFVMLNHKVFDLTKFRVDKCVYVQHIFSSSFARIRIFPKQ